MDVVGPRALGPLRSSSGHSGPLLGLLLKERAQGDQGVPLPTEALDLVVARAAGTVLRQSPEQLCVEQSRYDEFHQAVGQPSV